VATQQGLRASEQHRTLEGLAQEVIPTHVQTLDFVQFAIFGGEKQQGGFNAGLTKIEADGEAVALGNMMSRMIIW
jgi:hypothetical protein